VGGGGGAAAAAAASHGNGSGGAVPLSPLTTTSPHPPRAPPHLETA
jgi:hypothetical protein